MTDVSRQSLLLSHGIREEITQISGLKSIRAREMYSFLMRIHINGLLRTMTQKLRSGQANNKAGRIDFVRYKHLRIKRPSGI
ncbi:MAG: hypothetical protein ACJA0X_002165 [Cyclobacteriaceae bacterium]|jgi:hypothetical protein